jgi:hypothetical protein
MSVDGGIDLVGVAQATVAGALVLHFCLLRPWNARADLLLTVEMIDKDLTADIDRGSLPVDDPMVSELQRCLSLGRKRADAAQASANLLALLSPEEPAGLWPPSAELARLSPGQQNILLEYTEELADATAAYLRTTRPLRRSPGNRRTLLPRNRPDLETEADTGSTPEPVVPPAEIVTAPVKVRSTPSSIVFSEALSEVIEDAIEPDETAEPFGPREAATAAEPITGAMPLPPEPLEPREPRPTSSARRRALTPPDLIELPQSIDLSDAESPDASADTPAPTGHRPPIERTRRSSRLIAPEPLTVITEPNPADPDTLAAEAAAAAASAGPPTPGEGIRHSRDGRSGWHLRPRHARNQPTDAQIPPRILDLSTDVGYDGVFGNRSEDRRALDRRTLDRVSLDRAAVNRLLYNEVDVPSPFPSPLTPTADLPAVPSPRSGSRDGLPESQGSSQNPQVAGPTRPRPAPRLK